jgi:hypothetical protein
LTASIQPSIGSAKRTDTALVPYGVEMVALGEGAVVQVCPPLVVRAIARHMPDAPDAPDASEPHGTWPATHPSRADTNVTASGWNDAGTGVLGDGPMVVTVAAGRRGTTTMAGTEVAGVEVAGTVFGVRTVVVAGGTDDDGARVGAGLVGTDELLGPGATTPMRDAPPPGQLRTARVTPAATAAAVAAIANGQRRRRADAGASTV